MCKWGNTKSVKVKISDDLSFTKSKRWSVKKIDFCIVPIVEALQNADIYMRGSCCGHGKTEGVIDLQDGRILLVLNKKQAKRYRKHDLQLL